MKLLVFILHIWILCENYVFVMRTCVFFRSPVLGRRRKFRKRHSTILFLNDVEWYWIIEWQRVQYLYCTGIRVDFPLTIIPRLREFARAWTSSWVSYWMILNDIELQNAPREYPGAFCVFLCFMFFMFFVNLQKRQYSSRKMASAEILPRSCRDLSEICRSETPP